MWYSLKAIFGSLKGKGKKRLQKMEGRNEKKWEF